MVRMISLIGVFAILCGCSLLTTGCASGQAAQPAVTVSTPQIVDSPQPEVSGRGPYTLQIGSFERPDEATLMMLRLKRKGYDVWQKTESIPGIGEKIQVRVGHFSNREAAGDFAEQLKEREGIDSYICVDLE